MKIEDVNKQVDIFINWLENKVAVQSREMPDMWVIKIHNRELTDEDKSMISLLNNTDPYFNSLLYRKGYNDFEIGIGSIDFTNITEIRYIKKYE